MTKTFSGLEASKQKRIINAALKEFAEHQYQQASTNRIVKEAGIGKGMLFYYFKSKKELYHYLIDYSIDFTLHQYLHLIDDQERDFIERYKQAAQIKMKAHAENPDIFHFLGTMFLSDHADLPEALQARFIELREIGHAKMYRNIDQSLFRDDVEADKIFKMIRWLMEGYEKELLSQLKDQRLSSIDFEPYWKEFFEYLATFKTIFYKS